MTLLTLFASAAVPAAPVTVTPGVGALTAAGFAPSIGIGVSAGVGALAAVGQAPRLDRGVVPGVGALSLVGAAPSLDRGVQPGTGALAAAGQAPALDTGVRAGVGALQLSGRAPTLDTSVATGTGQLVADGSAPTIALGTRVTPGVGAASLDGQAPAIALGIRVDVGSLVVDGHAPALIIGTAVVTNPGALLVDGIAPSLGIAIASGAGALVVEAFAPSIDGAEVVIVGQPQMGRPGFRDTVRRRREIEQRAFEQLPEETDETTAAQRALDQLREREQNAEQRTGTAALPLAPVPVVGAIDTARGALADATSDFAPSNGGADLPHTKEELNADLHDAARSPAAAPEARDLDRPQAVVVAPNIAVVAENIAPDARIAPIDAPIGREAAQNQPIVALSPALLPDLAAALASDAAKSPAVPIVVVSPEIAASLGLSDDELVAVLLAITTPAPSRRLTRAPAASGA